MVFTGATQHTNDSKKLFPKSTSKAINLWQISKGRAVTQEATGGEVPAFHPMLSSGLPTSTHLAQRVSPLSALY